jgi:hypothetical protein
MRAIEERYRAHHDRMPIKPAPRSHEQRTFKDEKTSFSAGRVPQLIADGLGKRAPQHPRSVEGGRHLRSKTILLTNAISVTR